MDARAVITDGKGNFSVESLQVGDPQAGEVMVEIKASGVCHTDHKFLFRDTVQILGHEGAGIVKKVGPGVTGLAPGDPWFARLRDAYLEPWGRGLTGAFELAIRVGSFAHTFAWARQRDHLPEDARPEFDRWFATVLRRAIAQTRE